jgi:hypothetical protein
LRATSARPWQTEPRRFGLRGHHAACLLSNLLGTGDEVAMQDLQTVLFCFLALTEFAVSHTAFCSEEGNLAKSLRHAAKSLSLVAK